MDSRKGTLEIDITILHPLKEICLQNGAEIICPNLAAVTYFCGCLTEPECLSTCDCKILAMTDVNRLRHS